MASRLIRQSPTPAQYVTRTGKSGSTIRAKTTPAAPPLGSSISYAPTVTDHASGVSYLEDELTVRYKIIDLDNDSVADPGEIVYYDASRIPPENFTTGSPVVVIESSGSRAESSRSVQVEATRFPFAPNVLAAISSDNGVDVSGNVSICGHNHDPLTPVNTDLETNPACSPKLRCRFLEISRPSPRLATPSMWVALRIFWDSPH